MDVTLEQMLSARELRARLQARLNESWHLPLISFSMNIPGPVKDTPAIRRAFLAGCEALDQAIPQNAIRHRQTKEAVTGWEAVYVVDMDALQLKAITTAIEDSHGLGRLFDMDVLDAGLHKLDRGSVGGNSRDCMVCGAPGRGCASRRTHSILELQQAVDTILRNYFSPIDQAHIGEMAVQSLLKEAHTTPKPGLVDRRNTGSHRDMDLTTFTASALALRPYFCECVRLGMKTAKLSPEAAFPLLRRAGLEAEKTMLEATRGVNTHKGAIFTLGLLCGSAGRLWTIDGTYEAESLCREVSSLCRLAMEQDFLLAGDRTFGEKLYLTSGIRGIRGEAAMGLPSVLTVGLPRYRELRSQGLDENTSGVLTLLHLILTAQDTCLLHRGGPEGTQAATEKVKALLCAEAVPSQTSLERLDDWFIAKNLSPGGSADLLAATYFLTALT